MKPAALCQPHVDPATQLEWESAHFAADLEKRGLRCRPAASTRDAYTMFRFFTDLWAPADVETMPQLDRIVRYGSALMIEEATPRSLPLGGDTGGTFQVPGRLVAAQIAEHYADGTVQALRYGVDPLYRKTGLGAALVLQHAVDCAKRGGQIRRGMVELASPDALASLTVLLNHVGCVVDTCETYLYGEGRTVLLLTIPLTPLALVANRIDQAAAKEWVLSSSPHAYTLIGIDNPARIAALYRETPHRIVAVLPGGMLLAV